MRSKQSCLAFLVEDFVERLACEKEKEKGRCNNDHRSSVHHSCRCFLASPKTSPHSFARFEEMRSQHPVYHDEHLPIWQIFRYEDVATVFTDHTRFSSHAFAGTGSFLADTLIAKDPPDHRKLRNLVNLAFTPKAVAHLSERIRQIMQELLDQVHAQGQMDIVSDIAFPLPAKVIAEMLGVLGEDWDIFQRWARVDSLTPASTGLSGGAGESKCAGGARCVRLLGGN